MSELVTLCTFSEYLALLYNLLCEIWSKGVENKIAILVFAFQTPQHFTQKKIRQRKFIQIA